MAVSVPLGDLRVAGGVMLGAAAVGPLLGGVGVPCPLRSLTGIPCPFCGMTTSVTSTVWLRLGDAVAANPMGVVAVAFAVALLVRRRWSSLTLPAFVLPVVLALMWAFQLRRFDVL